MRRALSDLAIWEPADDLAETYLQFRALNERMRDILSDYTGEDIHLWDIEHAFTTGNTAKKRSQNRILIQNPKRCL